MQWEQVLKALPAVGLGFTIALACWWVIQESQSFRFDFEKINRIIRNSKSNDAFQHWIEITDQRLKKANSKINGAAYILLVLSLGVASFAFSLHVFRNITAAIFLSLSVILLPDQLVYIFVQRRKKLMAEQLVQAIRIFSAEFIQTPQLTRGFAVVAEKVPNPLGKVFRSAYRKLLANYDVNVVLADMMREIDLEYGQIFIQLLYQAKEDAAVTPLFNELIRKVQDYLELWDKNTAGLSGERVLSLIMAATPVPLFLFMANTFPDTAAFLIENFLGRIVISLAFASIFVWTLLDRLVGRVEI